MHSADEGPRGRPSLTAALSLGALVFGTVVVGWASYGIWAQTPLAATPFAGSGIPLSLFDTEPLRSSDASLGASAYPLRPRRGDTLGSLAIPALKQQFPIIEGTRTEDLKKGVGHMPETAMPGEADNCVLSGHRDTVFSRLGRLKRGDLFVVQTATGTYTYRITRIRIVHRNDRTVVVSADHPVLTVSTCYPFNYVGDAPDRYVLSADLVTP
jgi:sortase A